MITIPEELLEQVERGNVLLFIGERITRDVEGQAAIDRLVVKLAVRCDVAGEGELSFPEVAQAYEDEKKRQALVQFIRDQLEELGDEPQHAHRMIAWLTDCNVLATTCIDQRLERAFAQAKRPLDVIIGNIDVAFEDERKAQLYKLRGSVERAESLVLTEDDYEAFFEDQASISVVLQGYLARKTILFVGYDLADTHFKRLYRKVTAPLEDYARRAYAFVTSTSSKVSRWCKRHGIEVVEIDAATLLEALSRQLRERARPAPAAPRRHVEEPPPPLPERPYKLLDYYEAKDAAIFFGRREETQALTSLIHAHRLVLLYGASGTGKTSLLLAGTVPRLESAEPPYETIYVRALEDPALFIRRALRRRLPEANLLHDGSLVDFLDATTKALGRTLVIFLDQFEEFFIRLSPQFRAGFIAELGALYDAHDVPIKVVLSLREDWLAEVSEIEERIPEVFRTRMRLLPLSRDQARQAITAPVEQLGVSYQPALVEHLLDDLMGSEGAAVMPPQLQLVCSALYDGLRPDERRITLSAYEQLGRVRGVLRKYLDEELARLGSDEQALARGALEELVTSRGTKAVKAGDELTTALVVQVSDLEPVLEKLVRARLLRVLEREDGETVYELAHEYLIREIGLGVEAQARKQAEELIKQEVENWQRFGTLLAADKLALVGDVREVLRLSAEAQELLLRSALQVGHDVEYWLGRVSDPGQRMEVLAEAAHSELTVVRQRAAEALGLQDIPESVEPLLELAVRDPFPSVRAAAREGLVKLAAQRPRAVARLRSEMQSVDRTVRRFAMVTLAILPMEDLTAGLRLQVLLTRTRLRAVWIAKRAMATPLRRAMALGAVLLLALILPLYALSVNSYYVDTSPSSTSSQLQVVIRRGHPSLPLPGLGKVKVNTGIDTNQVSPDHWVEVNNKRLSGLWVQQSEGGYRQWAQDVASSLYLGSRVSMLWYLNEEEGVEALWEATDLQSDPPSGQWGIEALGQVAAVNPELATPQVIEALHLLNEYDTVPNSAAKALAQVMAINPELATQRSIEVLTKLAYGVGAVWHGPVDIPYVPLEYDGQIAATFALGQVAAANPQLAIAQVIEDLLDLMRSPRWPLEVSAANALAQIVAANPEMIPQQRAEKMLGKLIYDDLKVRWDSAGQLFVQIVSANPELATQEMVDQLSRLASSDILKGERSVDFALGWIVAANPELATPQVIEDLMDLLGIHVPEVSKGAAKALAQVVSASPELATQEMAEELLRLLTRREWWVRDSAAEALGQVLSANPELTTEQVVPSWLFGISQDHGVGVPNLLGVATPDPQQVGDSGALPTPTPKDPPSLLSVKGNWSGVLDGVAATLEQLIASNPELATQQMADVLIGLLEEEDWSTRANATYALGLVIKTNPELATQQMTKELIGLLTDPDVRVRIGVGEPLGHVVKANPGIVPQVTGAFVTLLLSERGDEGWNVKDSTAQAFARVVIDDPRVATPQVTEALLQLLGYEESFVRASGVQALEQVAVANPKLAPVADNALFARLTDPLDTSERSFAARALFRAALHNLTREETIRSCLEALSTSREPIARIWANTTLQMIDLTYMVHRAPDDPSQRREVRGKLEILKNAEFFGENFTWAAEETLSWLDQQATGEGED